MVFLRLIAGMVMQLVVRKKKYDGQIKSEWEGELLASDDPNWIVVLHCPKRHQKFANGLPIRADKLFLRYLHRVKPLNILVRYDADGQFLEAKFDAALPATQDDDIITFVDLDLDMMLESDFSSHLKDEDVFEQHRVAMNYSDEVVDLAWLGIDWAETLIEDRSFPFAMTYEQ